MYFSNPRKQANLIFVVLLLPLKNQHFLIFIPTLYSIFKTLIKATSILVTSISLSFEFKNKVGIINTYFKKNIIYYCYVYIDCSYYLFLIHN